MSADVLVRGNDFRPLSEAAKAYFSKFLSLEGGWYPMGLARRVLADLVALGLTVELADQAQEHDEADALPDTPLAERGFGAYEPRG